MNRAVLVVLVPVTMLSLCSSSQAAPAPEPPPPPFRLTVTLDRETYFEREPIFLEWAVTSVADRPLCVATMWGERMIRLECTDAQGKPVPLFKTWVACGGKPDWVPLNYKQSVRDWIELRTTYAGLVGTGEVRLRAVYRSAWCLPGSEDYTRFEVCSNEVAIRVVEARGADARALEQINPVVSQRWPMPAVATDAPPEKAHQERCLCEHQRDQLFLERGLCAELARQTGSARFRANAIYHLSLLPRNTLHHPNETTAQALVRTARESRALEGGSRFLKGDTVFNLLIQLASSESGATPQEIEDLAERIVADYPESWAAHQATRILDELKAQQR